MTNSEIEAEVERLKKLAGIKEELKFPSSPETATIFDAGSVPAMRETLKAYKQGSGDHSPSHVFVLGNQLFVATAVIGPKRP